jgi:hypothetical protein
MPKQPHSQNEGITSGSAVFQQEQNRLRGVNSFTARASQAAPISKKDKKKPAKGQKKLPSEQLYLDRLRSVLLGARRQPLTKQEQFRLVRFAAALSAEGIPSSRRLLGFGLGRQMERTTTQDFNQELAWLLARLDPFLGDLQLFRQNAVALDQAFWAGNEADVWRLLEVIEKEYGESLWSIELRLAFTQLYKDLDAQKAQLADYKKRHPVSIPSFFAHYYSIRNEASSTLRRFKDDAVRRLDKAKIDSQARDYLKYRIVDEFSSANEHLSVVVSREQSQSVLDIYETIVDVLQRLVRSRSFAPYKDQIIRCLDAWKQIDDFRLTKIAWALDHPCGQPISVRGTASLDALLNNQFKDALELSLADHTKNPADVLSGIESSVVVKLLPDCEERASPDHSPWNALAEPLWSVLLRSEKFEESLGTLDKFCRNFRGLPGAAAIGDFVMFVTAQGPAKRNSLGAFNLNLSTLSVWDLLNAGVRQITDLAGRLSSAGVDPKIVSVLIGKQLGQDAFSLMGAVPFLTALGLSATDADGAYISLLDVKAEQASVFMRGLIVSRRIELALHLGEFKTAISDIADEAARSPDSIMILPVEDALGGRDWADLSSKNKPLDLAIALDVAWRRTNNDVYGTYLRFALEDFLNASGVDKPSELTEADEATRSKLIYLLDFIAVPEVMDLTGIFGSSAEVIQERSNVCKLLLRLNPELAKRYNEELELIEKTTLIQEGLRIIDYSRINVDTGAISRWAEQQYRESYTRYGALVASGIGVSENLDNLVRNWSDTGGQAGDYLSTPDNEADSLLIEMILSIKEQFLSNEEFGLEFFLGKRIRHGTLVGHLRGPVENAGIITQRESEAQPAYFSNQEWLGRLHFQTEGDRAAVDEAFQQFSARYDAIARRLKDEFLHVKTKKYPKGVFEFQLSQLGFRIIRSAIKGDPSFDNFLGSCYTIFWSSLEAPLDKVRHILLPEAKDQAATLFDELQNIVRQSAVHDEEYNQFIASARGANVEAQKQFDSMLDWFIKREIEQILRRFSLREIVDISVRSAMKQNGGYQPNIKQDVQELMFAPVSLLVSISEILTIIITNACVRSRSGHSPQILIQCHASDEADDLILEVTNSLGPEYDREAAEIALGEIRRMIDSGEIQKGASAEVKSGLLKIAGLTIPQGGAIDFRIVDEMRFETVIGLKVFKSEGVVALMPAP